MACALTTGFALQCRDGAGGVKNVYLIELDNVASYTESSGTITAITKASGKVFFKYVMENDVANFAEAFTTNRQNGTVYYAQTLQMVINKLRAAVRNEIKLLAQNRIVAVVETMDGSAFCLGKDRGLMIAGGSAASGTAMADRNGYTIDLAADEKEPMYEVSTGILAGLLT
jgi:hypothetical protein